MVKLLNGHFSTRALHIERSFVSRVGLKLVLDAVELSGESCNLPLDYLVHLQVLEALEVLVVPQLLLHLFFLFTAIFLILIIGATSSSSHLIRHFTFILESFLYNSGFLSRLHLGLAFKELFFFLLDLGFGLRPGLFPFVSGQDLGKHTKFTEIFTLVS